MNYNQIIKVLLCTYTFLLSQTILEKSSFFTTKNIFIDSGRDWEDLSLFNTGKMRIGFKNLSLEDINNAY